MEHPLSILKQKTGWQYKDIARHIGVTPMTVSMWLHSGKFPRVGLRSRASLEKVLDEQGVEWREYAKYVAIHAPHISKKKRIRHALAIIADERWSGVDWANKSNVIIAKELDLNIKHIQKMRLKYAPRTQRFMRIEPHLDIKFSGIVLRDARVTVGLSQQKLAELIGCKQPDQVRLWENGTRMPSADFVLRLLAVLHLDTKDFEGLAAHVGGKENGKN